jgi:hypothetical protein
MKTLMGIDRAASRDHLRGYNKDVERLRKTEYPELKGECDKEAYYSSTTYND